MWTALPLLAAIGLADAKEPEPRKLAFQLGPAMELSQGPEYNFVSPWGLEAGLARTMVGPLSWEACLGLYGFLVLPDDNPNDEEHHLRALAGASLRATWRLRSGRPLLSAALGADLSLHNYNFFIYGPYGSSYFIQEKEWIPALRMAGGARLLHFPPFALDLDLGFRWWLGDHEVLPFAPFAALIASWGAS